MSAGPLISDAVASVCSQLATHTLASDDILVDARRLARSIAPLADDAQHDSIARTAVAQITGLGPLEAFVRDPTVGEIIVNNGRELWIERDGALEHVTQLDPDVAPRLIERILGPIGRRIDRLSPIVDARLADGSRVCAVIPPVAVDGPCLSVRKFSSRHRTLAEFATADVRPLLVELVDRRCNAVISGATSSGKTSLLNALASCIPASERVITLEDIAELRLDARHVLRLEARPATADGVPAITMTDLVRTALRLRPDRIVVGEVRGAEVVDMLQAFNTGHDGSLVTLHANSPADAVRRIAGLMAQHAPGWSASIVEDHVRASIDAIVHVERTPGGVRRVSDVIELAPPGAFTNDRSVVRGGRVVGGLVRGRV